MEYTTRSLRQRRNTDRWEIALTHKDPTTGEPRTTYHTITAESREQAEGERDRLIADLQQRGSSISSKQTVSELVNNYIKRKVDGGEIEESTAYHYRKDARVIDRYIGKVKVKDVYASTINQWKADMRSDGLAPRTAIKPYRLLRQTFKFAVATGVVTRNPFDLTKAPRIERKQITPLNRSERIKLLGIVTTPPRTPLKIAIHLALTTGLRRGEICGLRWSDFDEDKHTISVNRAIGIKEGGWYVKQPKTSASYRTIPLTPDLFDILSSMHEVYGNEARSFGMNPEDFYILGTQHADSRPYHPNVLSREFSCFRKEHGFDIKFHDLRHTFATMLISEGTDIRTVSSLMGHTSVSHTLDIYADADPEAKRNSVDKILSALT